MGLATDTTVYLSRRGEALKVYKLTFTIRTSDSSWHPGLPRALSEFNFGTRQNLSRCLRLPTRKVRVYICYFRHQMMLSYAFSPGQILVCSEMKFLQRRSPHTVQPASSQSLQKPWKMAGLHIKYNMDNRFPTSDLYYRPGKSNFQPVHASQTRQDASRVQFSKHHPDPCHLI